MAATPTSSSLLPEDYQPCQHTVIIGRGRQVHNHPGNRRLRDLVQRNAGRYTAASTTRELKTDIIVSVVSAIRAKSKVGFVKFDKANARWLQLEEAMARSAVGQAFRDLLQGYRSSKQSKQAKRLLEKQASQGILPVHLPTTTTTTTMSLPFTVPPPPSLNLPRVVSIDGHAATTTTSVADLFHQNHHHQNVPQASCNLNSHDRTCFDRLYSIVAMDQQACGLQGNPFEPRPIKMTLQHQDHTTSACMAKVAANARTARAQSYISMLKQQVVTPMPVPLEADEAASIAAV